MRGFTICLSLSDGSESLTVGCGINDVLCWHSEAVRPEVGG